MDGRDTELGFTLFGKEIKKRVPANGLMTFSEDGEELNLLEL